MPGTEMLLDLALAGLLVATLIYCFLLNRRLGKLRSARSDMAEMLGAFQRATEAARASVGELKSASEAVGMDLKNQVEHARETLDELELVSGSASRLADRIEQGVDRSRPSEQPTPRLVPDPEPAPRSEAERDLLQALREVR